MEGPTRIYREEKTIQLPHEQSLIYVVINPESSLLKTRNPNTTKKDFKAFTNRIGCSVYSPGELDSVIALGHHILVPGVGVLQHIVLRTNMLIAQITCGLLWPSMHCKTLFFFSNFFFHTRRFGFVIVVWMFVHHYRNGNAVEFSWQFQLLPQGNIIINSVFVMF